MFDQLNNKIQQQYKLGHFNELISLVSQRTGLTFISEKDTRGNLCYIDSPEVRDEFKIAFAPMDMLDYIYASILSSNHRKGNESLTIDGSQIPCPNNSTSFWKGVRLGREMRRQHRNG